MDDTKVAQHRRLDRLAPFRLRLAADEAEGLKELLREWRRVV